MNAIPETRRAHSIRYLLYVVIFPTNIVSLERNVYVALVE